MTSTSFVFRLDGAPISWNELYASPHWSVRRRIADAVHEQVWLVVVAFFSLLSIVGVLVSMWLFLSCHILAEG